MAVTVIYGVASFSWRTVPEIPYYGVVVEKHLTGELYIAAGKQSIGSIGVFYRYAVDMHIVVAVYSRSHRIGV